MSLAFCIAVFVVAAGNAEAKGQDRFAWPDSDEGPKTLETTKAIKRAGRHIGCSVCNLLVMYRVSFETEKNGYNPSEERGRFERMGYFGDHYNMACSSEMLMDLMQHFKFELKLAPNGTASLAPGRADEEAPYNWTGEIGNRWKPRAVEHACKETFRRDGDKVDKAIDKAVDGEEENLSEERIWNIASQACQETRACKEHYVEVGLAEMLQSIDEALAKNDPSFSASPEDLVAEPVVPFDKRVDYYRILGVDNSAPPHDIEHAVWNLKLLYGTRQGIDLAGIDEESAQSTMQEVNLAAMLLSHRATRRQYNAARVRMMLEAKYGLAKMTGDKASFDGKAGLLAYEAEMEELKATLGKKEEL